MTANQINYQKYLEDVRSHRANEQIAARQAAAAESQAVTAAENAATNRFNAQTNRANLALTESAVGAQWYGAQANAAYQTAMAEVQRTQAAETQRHNEQTERNTLLVEGWKATNEQTRIQTQADTTRYQTDVQSETQKRNVDVQTRAQIVVGLAGDVTNILTTLSRSPAAQKVLDTLLTKGG